MSNRLEQIQTELEKLKNKYVFQFVNKSTAEKLTKNEPGKYNSKAVWSYDDVVNYFGSFIGLLKHMQNNLNAEGVNILFRKPNGSRSIATKKEALDISFKKSQPMNNTTPQTTPSVTPAAQNQTYTPAPTPNFGLGVPGQSVGLGFAQVLDYEKKANRLELLEEYHAKQKKQIEALETLNTKLQRELDEANSKCRLAEDRKNFEVEKAEAKKQTFITPELIDAVMKNAPGILQSFSGQGSASQSNTDTGLGNPYANLTKDQQTLINEIAQGNFTENQQFIIYQIVEGLKTNPNLEVQLAAMFNQ